MLRGQSRITDIVFICGMGFRKREGWWGRWREFWCPGRWGEEAEAVFGADAAVGGVVFVVLVVGGVLDGEQS